MGGGGDVPEGHSFPELPGPREECTPCHPGDTEQALYPSATASCPWTGSLSTCPGPLLLMVRGGREPERWALGHQVAAFHKPSQGSVCDAVPRPPTLFQLVIPRVFLLLPAQQPRPGAARPSDHPAVICTGPLLPPRRRRKRQRRARRPGRSRFKASSGRTVRRDKPGGLGRRGELACALSEWWASQSRLGTLR